MNNEHEHFKRFLCYSSVTNSCHSTTSISINDWSKRRWTERNFLLRGFRMCGPHPVPLFLIQPTSFQLLKDRSIPTRLCCRSISVNKSERRVSARGLVSDLSLSLTDRINEQLPSYLSWHCLTPPNLTLSYVTLSWIPHLPFLTLTCLPYLILPYLNVIILSLYNTLSCLPYLTSSYLTSVYLALS